MSFTSILNMILENLLAENIEKKRPFIIKRLEDKQIPNNQHDRIIKWLQKADPVANRTNGKKTPFVNKILDWLLSGVVQAEDWRDLNDMLGRFNTLKNQRTEFRNIDLSTFDKPSDLLELIYKYAGEEEKGVDMEGAETYGYLPKIAEHNGFAVYEVNEWMPCEVEDQSARQPQHRALEGSGWCVRWKHTFHNYKPSIYYMFVKLQPGRDKRYSLLHLGSQQFKNIADRSMTKEEIAPIISLIKKVLPRDEVAAYLAKSLSQHHMYGDYSALVNFYDIDKSEFDPAMLKKINDEDIQLAINYTKNAHDGDWPEADKVAINTLSAPKLLTWAVDLKKASWPEAEAKIKTSPETAYFYARRVLKRRWPEGEAAISRNPKLATAYAERYDTTMNLSPAAKGFGLAMQSSDEVPEHEPAILTDLNVALEYSKRIKGPWDELESAIIRSGTPEQAFQYAEDVLMNRWVEGETKIKENPELYGEYINAMGL